MKCPKCDAADCYEGVLGFDCINPKCLYFKNGTLNGKVFTEIATPTKREFKVGDRVEVHRGMGWDRRADNYWMRGTVTHISGHLLARVQLDAGAGYVDPMGKSLGTFSWLSAYQDTRHIAE